MKIVFVVSLLLLVLLLLLWFLRGRSVPTPSSSSSTPPIQEQPSVDAPLQTSQPIEALPPSQAVLRAFASSFAERYGSYASETSFQNVRDVLPMMSEAFAARSRARIEQGTTSSVPYGVTTRVLSVTISDLDEQSGVAVASIATQREETRGSLPPTLSYAALRLDLVTENGSWKVNEAVWSDLQLP